MKAQKTTEQIRAHNEIRRERQRLKRAAKAALRAGLQDKKISQLATLEIVQARQTAVLEGNTLVASLAHEILGLRKRMRQLAKVNQEIQKLAKGKGRAKHVKVDGKDREIAQLRRLARRRARARARVLSGV